ncbi:ribose transport system permease protein [Amycolatopsis bartoniae]|uniref:Ribose ABC transporter permease n=1 Tax=Amycolatopsis bartoniae TaxID=941986 RepID=A0A8H9M9F4_9PSEU|nr:ABC transporter permease [Amycolatopsis bartoniae]MBB2937804.1 ribose transport system permease protein [Amycolatopsis bartoniae]TVT06529.1 ABC transporter permease [Amycolatopsis bartoniae]GHF40828.1 ribose ABC transporter permease [Amycolatopsis bartoniae]
MTTVKAPAPERQQGSVSAAIRSRLQQLLAFASLVVIYAFFSIVSPFFFSYGNFIAILYSTVVIGTLAIGTTFVIISAGIDLSIGTGMALCAVMAGVFMVKLGLPLALGVPLSVLFGGVLGLVNGINVALLRIPPFIATLAMMLVAEGLALVLSNSTPIYFTDVAGYSDLSIGNLIPNVPNGVLILLVVAIIAGVLLTKSVLGRYTYSIGSNEEATALSGIDVRKWKIAIYAFAGLFTGLAGVMISARLGSAQPATGMGYELQAIAAVVIGGTSLSGGKGSIVGTLIGALIISVLNNGLQIMSIPQEWQNVILGGVILVAVYTDRIRKKEA